MADVVWVVSYADVPMRRVVFGKRTQSHVYYQAFQTREDALGFVKSMRDAWRADQEAAAERYEAMGLAWATKAAAEYRRSAAQMPMRYTVGAKPANLWPVWDGSRKGKAGGWQSYDNVRAMWKREQKKRIAAIAARRAS